MLTVIMPEPLHFEAVQKRLSREPKITCYWQLVAPSSKTWIIVSHYLPVHITEDLEELEDLRRQGEGAPR